MHQLATWQPSAAFPPTAVPPPLQKPLPWSLQHVCVHACDVVPVYAVCRLAIAERLLRDTRVESYVRCEGPRRCSSTSSDTIYKVRQAGKVADLPDHHLYIGRRPRRLRPGLGPIMAVFSGKSSTRTAHLRTLLRSGSPMRPLTTHLSTHKP